MIRFVDEPYLTDKIRPKLSSIKWKLVCGIGMTNVHFITLSDNEKDLFDIYPAAVFKQKHVRKQKRVILGVADDHKSAEQLVGVMITDCMNSGQMSDIRGYFEKFIKDHL